MTDTHLDADRKFLLGTPFDRLLEMLPLEMLSQEFIECKFMNVKQCDTLIYA